MYIITSTYKDKSYISPLHYKLEQSLRDPWMEDREYLETWIFPTCQDFQRLSHSHIVPGKGEVLMSYRLLLSAEKLRVTNDLFVCLIVA